MDDRWYREINPLIGLDEHDTVTFISAENVSSAAGHFWMNSAHRPNWLPDPTTFDSMVRLLTADLYAVAMGQQDSIDLTIRITNSDDVTSRGTPGSTSYYM